MKILLGSFVLVALWANVIFLTAIGAAMGCAPDYSHLFSPEGETLDAGEVDGG